MGVAMNPGVEVVVVTPNSGGNSRAQPRPGWCGPNGYTLNNMVYWIKSASRSRADFRYNCSRLGTAVTIAATIRPVTRETFTHVLLEQDLA